MSRRAQLPRRRRSGLAILTGLVIVAACVLGTITAIQIFIHQNHTVLGKVSGVAHGLRITDWSEWWSLLVAIVCLVLGAWLLLAGLIPARRPFLRLDDPDEHTISGVTRKGLDRDLAGVANAVDGVSSAKVKVRRRRLKVKARSALRDPSGLRDAVDAAVDARIKGLLPQQPLPVSVRIKGGGN